MKFHLQTPTSNLVTGTGPGWVRVGSQDYHGNILLTADAVTQDFAPRGFDELTEADFERLLASIAGDRAARHGRVTALSPSEADRAPPSRRASASR